VAVGQEAVTQVRADEAGAAGNQDMCHLSPPRIDRLEGGERFVTV
jgi:hypothetical protein